MMKYLFVLGALLLSSLSVAQTAPCDTTANCCYERCGQNRTCYCDCLYRSALLLRDNGAYSEALRRLEAVNQLCPNIDTKSVVASIYDAHRIWDVREDDKMALISILGERLTKYEFIEQRPFSRGRYLARHESGDYCIVDKNGRISERYNYIFPTNNGWFKVRKDGNRETFVDSNLVQIPGWDWYFKIGEFYEGLALFSNSETGNKGVISWQGAVKLPTTFQVTDILSQFAVTSGYGFSNNLGVLNIQGDTLQPVVFSECTKIDQGLFALVREDSTKEQAIYVRLQAKDFVHKDVPNGEVILIDKLGNKIFQESFDRVPSFQQSGVAIAKSSGKWGIIHKKGEILLPFKYDSIHFKGYYYRTFQEGGSSFIFITDTIRKIDGIDTLSYDDTRRRFAFRQNGRWGLLDTLGKILTPPISDQEIRFDFYTEHAFIKTGQKYGLLNLHGKIVIDTVYDRLETYSADRNVWRSYIYPDQIPDDQEKNMGLIAIPRVLFRPGDIHRWRYVFNEEAYLEGNNWCGIISYNKKYINYFYPTSDTAYRSENYIVYKKDSKWGARFLKKDILIPPRFDCFFFFKDGFAAVCENGKWSIINTMGNNVVPPIADEPFMFDGPYAIVKKDNQCAVVDKKGNFKHQFMSADLYTRNGFVYGSPRDVAARNYLDAAGHWVFPDSIPQDEPSQGYLKFKTPNGYGLMDSTLHVLIPAQFAYIDVDPVWTRVHEHGGGYRVYLTQEKKFYSGDYTEVDIIRQKFLYLQSKSESKLIDKSGRVLLSAKEITIQNYGYYSDSIFTFSSNKKYGLIHENGKIVLPAILGENIYRIGDDIRSVSVNGKYGLLDKLGNWLIEPTLEEDVRFVLDAEYSKVVKNGQTGVVNRKGKIVIPFSKRDLGVDWNGKIYISEGGHYFPINEKAQLVVKPE